MSSTSTRASRSRGTLRSSAAPPTCKGGKSRLRPAEKISKYFAKVTNADDDSENSNDPADSPYKSCISQVKGVSLNTSHSDSDDFKTPQAINKVSKILSKVPTKNAKRKRMRQPQLPKLLKDNLQCSDVNPDHLQMALALSESSYEAENPNDTQTSQEKRESFKAVFEKFGFGYPRTKLPVENRREPDGKKPKKSRWRYITPVLKTRTNEERAALISSKASLILAQNSPKSSHNVKFEAHCDSLVKHVASKIFRLNGLELDRLNDPDLFYIGGLRLERSPASNGRLLKDWRKIPGREATPERAVANRSAPRDETPPTMDESSNHSTLATPNSSERSEQETTTESATSNQNDSDDEAPPSLSDCETLTNENVKRNLSPPSSNGNSNQSSVIQASKSPPASQFSNQNSIITESPPSLRDNETLTNESSKRSGLTPPTPSEMAGEIPRKDDEEADCFFIESPQHEETNATHKSAKYSLSPLWERFHSEPMAAHDLNVTPPRSLSFGGGSSNRKRIRDCISPDLFDSDDDQPPRKITPEIDRLRGGHSQPTEQERGFDLTRSDEEEKSFHLRLSDPEYSMGRRSDLNVTEYVHELLSQYKETSGRVEKISTNEDDSREELNDSCVFGVAQAQKKVEYNFSDDEDFGRSLAARIEQKKLDGTLQEDRRVSPQSSDKSEISLSLADSSATVCYELSQKIFNDDVAPSCSDKPPEGEDQVSSSVAPPPLVSLDDSFNDVLEAIPANTPPTSSRSFLIKTKDVTPMANYEEMDSPNITQELDKFGLKPLKRKKATQLLKYIYESTHPLVGDEDRPSANKRRTPEPEYGDPGFDEEGEIILEKRPSKRVASCAVPLHVVWYNLVRSDPTIRESILSGEPLEPKALQATIKDQGFKFNIKDLLAFLDKKGVTIRTARK